MANTNCLCWIYVLNSSHASFRILGLLCVSGLTCKNLPNFHGFTVGPLYAHKQAVLIAAKHIAL
jgi:hypothetical protein